MMRMKKILCIVLTIIMLVSLFGCSGRNNDTDEKADNEEVTQDNEVTQKPVSNARASFILPYIESDTLNPYKAKTQINRAFTTLLYDSLYRLDDKYMPSGLIAKSAEVTAESVTVTLDASVGFTDSTPLNADDVVYSFEKAKESDRYSALLGGISGASALERYKVKFTLESPDVYALNVLTFPIIEYGSIDEAVPLGSGRYAFSSGALKYNKEHISGKKPSIKTIQLCPLSDRTNEVDALQIGNISFIFKDLSDCTVQRAVARNIPLVLNNLVYIGINNEKGVLGDEVFRQAINLSIDKDDIVSRDYQTYAVKTESPFNPLWSETTRQESVFDQSKAVELLESGGYTYRSETDKYRSDKDGRTLSVSILVCKDNEFRMSAANNIAKYLSQIGINAVVTGVELKKYKEAVKSKSFDLYIGEIKLCENMSLSPFFTKSGKARYGIDLKSTIVDSYKKLLSGDLSVEAFESEFSNALPFIPLCYRQGIIMVTNTLSENTAGVSTDLFYNIDEWEMN